MPSIGNLQMSCRGEKTKILDTPVEKREDVMILDTPVEKREDMRIGGTRRDKPAVFIGRAPLLRRIRSSRSAPRLVEKDPAENAQKAA